MERPILKDSARLLVAASALCLAACASPLQKASGRGDYAAVQAQLTKGADIEAVSSQGLTPLMWAAFHGHASTVKLLLDKGAKINAIDHRGRGALWYAATEGHLSIVKLLCERGADHGAMDSEGTTVIHGAQERGETEIVQYLAALDTAVSPQQLQSALDQAAEKSGFGKLSSKPARTSDVDAPNYRLPERPDDIAVVVGIEKYQSVTDADYAARDADVMRRHAQALGFPRRNTIYLAGSNATRSALESYLTEWLPKNVKADSNVLFYFSGHGSPDLSGGDSFLVPWDGNPSFLRSSAYPVKSLYAQLSALKARSVLVVLDTCFSGAGGRSVLPAGSRPLVSAKDEEKVPGNLTVFAAAGGSEITSSLDEQGHGLFTYYFLKGLNGEARDSGGKITLDGVYWYLKPLVQAEARRRNREQTPVLENAPSDPALFR